MGVPDQDPSVTDVSLQHPQHHQEPAAAMTDAVTAITGGELDMVNRDPNNINDHLKVSFEDVFAEPEGAHSIPCVWKCSFTCFNCCKNLTYMILTLFYSVCIAMEWGVEIGRMAFIHIWYITPLFKVLEINCGCCQKLYGLCVHCCLDPCCEACGLCFHQFKK